MMRRKSPKVTTVIGKVRNMRTGLTVNLKSARTTATITAVRYPFTEMPGRISANTITATAVNNNLKISFMVYLINVMLNCPELSRKVRK